MRTDVNGIQSSGESAVIAASILAWTDARFAAEQAKICTEGGIRLLASPAGEPPRESTEFQLSHTDFCPSGAVSCFTQDIGCQHTQSPCYTEICTSDLDCSTNQGCPDTMQYNCTEWGCSTQIETCTQDC